jgi:hypothetical protein
MMVDENIHGADVEVRVVAVVKADAHADLAVAGYERTQCTTSSKKE